MRLRTAAAALVLVLLAAACTSNNPVSVQAPPAAPAAEAMPGMGSGH
jgi:hypothetical protein